MSSGKQRDIAASVRQKLLNYAREKEEDFQIVLNRYGLERLMYRLGQSEYAGQFIVKGAILFSLWLEDRYRVTRDLDLLSRGENQIPQLERIFRSLCEQKVEKIDGILFAEDTVHGENIREEQAYGGIRITLTAFIGQARLPLQIDVGFGDAVTPIPKTETFRSILDFPSPRLKVCPKETVVAEKLNAMVVLGIINGRMKDFYDVWSLCMRFDFDGETLGKAIRNTFVRRHTQLSATKPVALLPEFYENEQKQAQWKAFLKRSGIQETRLSLREVVLGIDSFLMPLLSALANETAFTRIWRAGKSWQ
jgi:hypothetical protein